MSRRDIARFLVGVQQGDKFIKGRGAVISESHAADSRGRKCLDAAEKLVEDLIVVLLFPVYAMSTEGATGKKADDSPPLNVKDLVQASKNSIIPAMLDEGFCPATTRSDYECYTQMSNTLR